MALVVGQGTSGAAEVFAAALDGNDRADLIGEHTLGRTARQRLVKLPDGSGLLISESPLPDAQERAAPRARAAARRRGGRARRRVRRPAAGGRQGARRRRGAPGVQDRRVRRFSRCEQTGTDRQDRQRHRLVEGRSLRRGRFDDRGHHQVAEEGRLDHFRRRRQGAQERRPVVPGPRLQETLPQVALLY